MTDTTTDDVRAAARRLMARANTVDDQDRVAVWSDDIRLVAGAVERQVLAIERLREELIDRQRYIHAEQHIYEQRVTWRECDRPTCLTTVDALAATAPADPEGRE